MKKIFLLIALCVITLHLFAQNVVSISGTVIDINTGAPLMSYPVTIHSDSSSGFYYYNVVYTNPNGYFQDSMMINPSATQGLVHVSVVDCQQYTHTVSLPYDPGNMSLTTTFSICAEPSGCVAAFFYTIAGTPLTLSFYDQSIGGNGIRVWEFGDGTTSNLLNPVHTFPAPGYYTVNLTIGALGTTCWDQETMILWVGDSTNNACQALFSTSQDPLTAGLVHFLDQSIGNIETYTWDFGDNNVITVTSPGNPSVSHQYNVLGTYNVCLTVQGADSLCASTFCTIVTVDTNFSQCQAGFTYSAVPGAPQNTIQFIDQSISADSITWNWFFNDPTSGTNNTSNLQNPIFTFGEAGTYNVCLTISGLNCYDMFCYPVTVGQQQGCIADFEALPAPNTMSTFLFNDISQGNIQSWTWNFGDGTTQTVAFPNNPDVTHSYQVPGVYNACLVIQGNDSLCSDTKCLTIYVNDTLPGCQAQFTFANVPGASPNVFQFTDASLYAGQVSWFWNFDDGTVSTEQNPIHTFPAGPVIDPYFVCLTITSGDSLCTSTICLPVFPQNQGCQADFEALPLPNTPLTINFVDHSIGINIWLSTWDFGDGTIDTILSPGNPNISHTYQAPGFYNVCLTIQGDFGLCNSTYCETVAVYDSLPGCQSQYTYYADPTAGTENTLSFIDLSLGNPTQWNWEFGDPASGQANVSTEQNPVHVFSAPGTYYVCLTISGPDCQSVWCGNVEVGPVTFCVNYYTYSQIGQSVNFQGYMVNGVSELYAWDFGDNQVGTGPNITHTYDSQGTYFVTLTTMDPATGCSYSSSQVISVGDSTIWGQLYGQVLAGNFPATQGMVFLFSVDTNNTFVPFVDIAVLDSAGVYYFPMVPSGNYVIYAIPFESGYLPTYYGNTLNWQNATLVQPLAGTPNIPYNINLILSNGYTAGAGSIGGQITQGDVSGSLVDKVTMLLKDEFGNTILYSQVDPSGIFDFSLLAYGTYYLYAEMAGCETEPIKVMISESNPNVEVMLTLKGNSILGIQTKQISLDAGVVYPNPVKNDAQITVKMTTASELNIELYSMTGQLIYTNTEPVSIGETTVVISASQLPEGIYLLKIYTREGQILTRKFVKTN
jgi:PKD repeat protein